MQQMEPLLKWVGSKRWIASEISEIVSTHLDPSGTYIEPFAGSAAVFFAVNCKHSILSDTLAPLIATYQDIRDRPNKVWSELRAVGVNANTEVDYTARRSRFNKLLIREKFGVEFTALFIYLNKAGFNGLWRQTKDGIFNVPFGKHKSIKLPTRSDLIIASSKLQSTRLIPITIPVDVFDIIRQSRAGDVIFADPPYFETFTGYDGLSSNSSEFHQRLAIELWNASLRGTFVIAANNDTPETRKWYSPFCKIKSIKRQQNIAGTKEGRKPWNQLIATTNP